MGIGPLKKRVEEVPPPLEVDLSTLHEDLLVLQELLREILFHLQPGRKGPF